MKIFLIWCMLLKGNFYDSLSNCLVSICKVVHFATWLLVMGQLLVCPYCPRCSLQHHVRNMPMVLMMMRSGSDTYPQWRLEA